ncbi:hypothetical protein EFK50_01040 [Nocardioides marmoriginsengisoli]|uniref:Uncharacterized protein n=1 Tax=Nocardioides marmoriginsengisoli TaxID=661483 RepID=A0A3N0CRX8_9ACTN|nr:hypothetical protein [Nocardioides marmoriginsengisoli]RNL66242.1 hypothetical protein EFK50_01040 [Nocardioides marmoriginsengisoli]
MPDYIRVKDRETKHEYSIVASTLSSEVHERLKKDAVHTDGSPLPPKYYRSPESLSSNASGGSPASASSGQKATPEKEAN